jgi:hypothetical protein
METIGQRQDLNTTEADTAHRRVDAILRAYGVQHAAFRGIQTQRILTTALNQKTDSPKPLESVAAQIVLHELQAGLEKLGESIASEDAAINSHRLLIALKKTPIPLDYPDAILGHAPLPSDQINALRSLYNIQNRPALKRSSMGAPKLRFESIDGMTSQAVALFDKIPFSKNALALLGIVLVFFLVYFYAK